MQSVSVRGRFITEDQSPISGRIKFTPHNVWIEEGDFTYPCLHQEVALNNGGFMVLLTGGQTYKVECPIGRWTVHIPDEGPLLLRDLLPNHVTKKK